MSQPGPPSEPAAALEAAAGFAFRIKLVLGPGMSLPFPERAATLEERDGIHVQIHTSKSSVLLSEAGDCAVVGKRYATSAEALDAADRWRGRLTRTFASLGITADFGDRAHFLGGAASQELERMAEFSGRPVINDRWGPVVYAADQEPMYIGTSGQATAGVSEDRFRLALTHDASNQWLGPKPRLAYDLLTLAAFIGNRPDARLVMLMSAIEALAESRMRDPQVIAHIDDLVDATTSATHLRDEQREPLANALRGLKRESARVAGQRLAAEMNGRLYDGMTPSDFYKVCYDTRNALVHARSSPPSRNDVLRRGSMLAMLVSDLIAGRSLVDDISPR